MIFILSIPDIKVFNHLPNGLNTGRIKMIGAVWKLIIFTSMVN